MFRQRKEDKIKDIRKVRHTGAESHTTRRRRVATALSAVIAAALLLSACGQKTETVPEFVLTYSDNQTADYPTTQGAQYFAEQVEKRTNGRIRILVYPNAQLGEEVSALEQVKLGGIDFVRASMSTLTRYSPEAIVLMLPYLYQDSDHMWRVLESSVGDRMMASFDGTGLVGLSWYDAGVRNFYFTEKVTSLDEFQNKVIRVQQSELMQSMIRCLGAVSVPLSYSDVYGALERGEADGAENNWTSYEAMGHYKVAPYFLLDEHMRVPEMQIMSQSTMDKLTEEDQRIIRACAAESSLYERRVWQEQESAARETVLQEGVTEITLNAEQKEAFRQAMAPLYEEYAPAGSSEASVLKEIEAMREDQDYEG